jgi:hypothetical protein
MSQPLVLQIDCERRLIDMMMYEYVECCSVSVVRFVRYKSNSRLQVGKQTL